MRRNYSRLSFLEQKKDIKNTYKYIFLTVVFGAFAFFLGLPVIIKFASFFTNFSKSDKPVDRQDITPPAPPVFENIPEYTSKESIEVKGSSEEGATIILTVNGNDEEVVADSDGKFTFKINLKDGENTIKAIAVDTSANQSMETNLIKINFDNEDPIIEVESPENEASFYGSTQRQVVIKGNTDPQANMTINDRVVSVNDDGTFTFATTLSEGANEFVLKATDKAQNSTETKLTLNFTP